MSLYTQSSRQAVHGDLVQQVTDLLEGKGSEASRRLTKEMLKTLPSLQKFVPVDYQEQLRKVLAN